MGSLNPIAAVALARAVPSKALKQYEAAIADGANQKVELTAKIDARVTRGEATEAAATCDLLNEAVLAEVIRRLGVTRSAFEATLREVANEAIIAGVPLKERLISQAPELLTVIYTVKKNVVEQLPKRPRAGALKVVAGVEFTRLKVA